MHTSGPDAVAGLVRRAADGDEAAFAALVEATYADTWTLALRLVGNPHDAADVVQEVYVRVHRSVGQFRGESRFTTWLYRITANCARTFLGRRRRHRRELASPQWWQEHERPDAGHASVGESVALRAALNEAVAGLPPKLRAVVVLHDVYGLTHDAIAADLGIGVPASKVRLHRARAALRVRLRSLGVQAPSEGVPAAAPATEVRRAVPAVPPATEVRRAVPAVPPATEVRRAV